MSYLGKLMQSRHTSVKHAFTIVELLIVIVVIGILAAIATIAYNGIRTKAVTVSLQSDLSENQKIIQSYAIQNSDQYPLSQPSAVANGLKSNSNTLSYRWIGGNNYCLLASNTSQSTQYYVTNALTVPTAGSCPVVVNMFVGSTTTSGYVDGSATGARFQDAFGLAFDSSGALYISEFGGRIRKATPAGIVTTVANTGVPGLTGIAFDSLGNLYMADQSNNFIRKLTPGGVMSIFAGTGTAGYADGSAVTAQFKSPRDIAIDSLGNLYVTDVGNFRIRKITPSGTVSTFAGSGVAGTLDGTGTSAKIVPSQIAVDSSNNLFITCGNGNIRKITTPAAVVTTVVGYGGDVQAPEGIEVDSTGTLYVSDIFSLTVYKVNPAGVVTRLAGNGSQAFVNGLSSASSFTSPGSVALDQAGTLYVSDNIYVATLLQ